MYTLNDRIRAAITGMGFMWGNTTELRIGEPQYMGCEELLHVTLEYQHILIPCLVVDRGSFVDLFMSPNFIMSFLIEPRLKQHDYEHPFLLGA